MRGALEDTICAIATPLGEGGIGIVRISGPDALRVAGAVARLRSGRLLSSLASHHLHLADLLVRQPVPGGDGPEVQPPVATVDEGLVVYMKSPRSFTGEDVVEIHSHGGGLLLSMLCRACVAAGARLAEPGEFTMRAFLNGRVDLSQAEAVLDTIRAKSSAGLAVAQRQLRGDLAREIERARTALLNALAQVEAGIDFVEEDISFLKPDALRSTIEGVAALVRGLESTYRQGRILRDGARVVILGRPNVGKSSLLNRLLREERAIVTPIPGTTRDIIEESIDLDGLRIHVIDTAGIRASEDPVEQEGIKRSRSAQAEADLQLIVVDGSRPLTDDDRELLKKSVETRHLVIENKADLPAAVTREELGVTSEFCRISALTGSGIDSLREKIRGCLIGGGGEADESPVITNVRHREALQRAGRSLDQAIKSIEENMAGELICIDLRAAADALGEITGAITTDEILERIFSEFCIGK